MNKKDFLRLGAALALSTSIPYSIHAQQPQLKYPITSIADFGTTLNPRLAEKARKLATYVITKNNQYGVSSYNPNSTLSSRFPGGTQQSVEAVMTIDEEEYKINVDNFDESRANNHDRLLVSVGNPSGNEFMTFMDGGLDGRCDIGTITAGRSPTGNRLNFQNDAIIPSLSQHREIFQRLYEKTLDKLIEFYERFYRP